MSTPEVLPRPARHVTSGGARIYTLPLQAFPHFSVNAFLVVTGEPSSPAYTALIDTGSSHPDSTADLLRGLDAVRDDWREQWHWDTLSRVVITHAHPDHVAGLPFVRERTAAPVAAHRMDVRTIEQPEAARNDAAARLDRALQWSGLDQDTPQAAGYAARMRSRASHLMLPSGVQVETVLDGGEVLDGLFTVIHVPGHQGGQVCLRLDDVLLSADHLLPHNSPPLMPERAQAGAGLAHYLASLDRIEALEGVRLALGSHDGPMPDWRGRIVQLRERYADKLEAVLAAADEPQTVLELTLRLYPTIRQAQALLLIDQTGALIEYLLAQGRLTERRREGRGPVFQRIGGG